MRFFSIDIISKINKIIIFNFFIFFIFYIKTDITITKIIFNFFIIMIIFFIAITGILYATIGKTSIPIKKIEYNENCDFNNIILNSDKVISSFNIKCDIKKEDESLELNVNIIIYSMAVLTFLSWIIFALFGGIGLA